MSSTIKVPTVTWALGDREQETRSGVTVEVRPLYFRPGGQEAAVRVGTFNPDFAERVLQALMAPEADSPEKVMAAAMVRLKASIETDTAAAVEEFYDATGVSPRAIRINMLDVTSQGDPLRRYAVGDVAVDLQL